jgi:hypothetical protein
MNLSPPAAPDLGGDGVPRHAAAQRLLAGDDARLETRGVAQAWRNVIAHAAEYRLGHRQSQIFHDHERKACV